MTRRSIKNPIGVVFYNEEIDQISFETFPTQPGITIRLTEAAGVCMAMAQWFLGQLPLTSSRDTKDIEDTLREAAGLGPAIATGKVLCKCGHMRCEHYPASNTCMYCTCNQFERKEPL